MTGLTVESFTQFVALQIGDTFTMEVPLRGWRRFWAWLRRRPLTETRAFKVAAVSARL